MTDTNYDPLLEEIKTSTGWNQVVKKDSGYVITFHEGDASKIRGLAKNDTTFYLTFEKLTTVPICFHIIRHDRHFQYWTLNDQLHRSGDKPAYIMYDERGKRYHRRWYWHGLMHRIGGPAEEAATGYSLDDSSYESHTREEFKHLEMEWWTEGVRNTGMDGIPIWANVEEGWRYRNKATGLIDSPNDGAAFYADGAKVEWDNPGGRMVEWQDRRNEAGELRPTRMIMTNVSEIYHQGKLEKRNCQFFEMQWSQAGRELDGRSPKMVQFNEAVKDNLLTELNIWNGSLLGDAETELILVSEFDRIYNSEELD